MTTISNNRISGHPFMTHFDKWIKLQGITFIVIYDYEYFDNDITFTSATSNEGSSGYTHQFSVPDRTITLVAPSGWVIPRIDLGSTSVGWFDSHVNKLEKALNLMISRVESVKDVISSGVTAMEKPFKGIKETARDVADWIVVTLLEQFLSDSYMDVLLDKVVERLEGVFVTKYGSVKEFLMTVISRIDEFADGEVDDYANAKLFELFLSMIPSDILEAP